MGPPRSLQATSTSPFLRTPDTSNVPAHRKRVAVALSLICSGAYGSSVSSNRIHPRSLKARRLSTGSTQFGARKTQPTLLETIPMSFEGTLAALANGQIKKAGAKSHRPFQHRSHTSASTSVVKSR